MYTDMSVSVHGLLIPGKQFHIHLSQWDEVGSEPAT